MKMCKVCKKKPRTERRIDSEGNVFCCEECFEIFEDGPDDTTHPYIDDYEAIRFAYTVWMQNYEEDLYKSIYFGYPKKTDLLERIDDTIEPYWSYYGQGGDDRIFSAEIYNYMQQLLKLQKLIKTCEVTNKKYNKWLKKLRVSKLKIE